MQAESVKELIFFWVEGHTTCDLEPSDIAEDVSEKKPKRGQNICFSRTHLPNHWQMLQDTHPKKDCVGLFSVLILWAIQGNIPLKAVNLFK